jgi:hypothetical protein
MRGATAARSPRASGGTPSDPERTAGSPLAQWPLSLVTLAVPIAVGAIRIVLSLHRDFTSGGDVAFIELSVRQVFHGGIALGPYSRFNWRHPGPSLFYLFAPLYWLSGQSSRSLFLSAFLINGLSACAVVAIVRRRAGETTARLAAAVLGLYLGAASFHYLINPWNPSVLALPLLLVLVGVAAAATGSTTSLVVAYVTGSYLVQTHIGTLPVTGCALLVGTVAYLWQLRGADRHPAVRPLLAGAGILVVMWAAPVVQQVTHAHGNVTEIVDFFRNPGPVTPRSHLPSDAFAAVSNYAAYVPFGRPTDLLGHRGRLLTAGAMGLAGFAVGVLAWRRRRFVAWLGILGSASLLVAGIATTRVVGPLYGYLLYYTQTLTLPAMFGSAALIWYAGRRFVLATVLSATRWSALAGYAGVVTMVVVTAMVTRTVVHSPPASYQDSPDARAVARRIEALAGHDRSRVFQIDLTEHGFSSGPVLLTLAKDGYHFHVTPELDLYDGNGSRPVTGPTFELQSAASAALGARLPGTHIETVGHLDLWIADPTR